MDGGLGTYLGQRIAAARVGMRAGTTTATEVVQQDDVVGGLVNTANSANSDSDAVTPPPSLSRGATQEEERNGGASLQTTGKEDSGIFSSSSSEASNRWTRLRASVNSFVEKTTSTASAAVNADGVEKWRTLFEDIPSGEVLVEDFSCALQRDILIQGRLYITGNYLLFYSYILGWETKQVIPIADVIEIERELTARLIPNAIKVITGSASYTFSSFLFRETSFRCISEVILFARGESTSTIVELAARRDSSWRDDEDADIAEETASGKHSPLSLKGKRLSPEKKAENPDSNSAGVDDVDTSMGKKKSAGDSSSVSQPNVKPRSVAGSPTRDRSASGSNHTSPALTDVSEGPSGKEAVRATSLPIKKTTDEGNVSSASSHMIRRRTTTSKGKGPKKQLRLDVVDEMSNELGISTSPGSKRAGRTISSAARSAVQTVPGNALDLGTDGIEVHNCEYNFSVETLFRLLYGDPDPLMKRVCELRGMSEFDVSDWYTSKSENRLEKTVEYRLALNYSIGPRSAMVYEIHQQLSQAPRNFYLIEAVHRSPAVPYGKSFHSTTRVLLTSVGPGRSRLQVHGLVTTSVSFFVTRNLIISSTKEGMDTCWGHVHAALIELTAKLSPDFESETSHHDLRTVSPVEPSSPKPVSPTIESREPYITQVEKSFEINPWHVVAAMSVLIILCLLQLYWLRMEVAELKTSVSGLQIDPISRDGDNARTLLIETRRLLDKVLQMDAK